MCYDACTSGIRNANTPTPPQKKRKRTIALDRAYEREKLILRGSLRLKIGDPPGRENIVIKKSNVLRIPPSFSFFISYPLLQPPWYSWNDPRLVARARAHTCILLTGKKKLQVVHNKNGNPSGEYKKITNADKRLFSST